MTEVITRAWRRTPCNKRFVLWVAVAPVMLACVPAPAETVVTNLPLVFVTAPALRDAGWYLPGDTAAAAAGSLPTVAVQSQGGAGAQNDLSIRGSAFSGAGLSVAGLALRNPQTEHFHAELPIPPAILSAPRLSTGMDQALDGEGHLVGSVRFEIAPVAARGALEAGFGESARQWQTAMAQTTVWEADTGRSVGIGGFAGRETATGVDYPDNDLDREYLGAQAQVRRGLSQFDLIAGRQKKEYGARGYYGVTPAWAADEELDDVLFLASQRWDAPSGEPRLRLSAAWREVEDRYRLFWTQPGVFENQHTSRVATASADGVVGAGAEGAAVTWRAAWDRDEIRSSALGDHTRDRGTLTAIPRFVNGDLRIDAGARAEVYTGDSPALLPQARVAWNVAPMQAIYAAFTASARQPSYTELNYDSPGSLGTAGLARQENDAAELGWSHRDGDFSARAALFAHRSRNTVDWVRATSESTRWQATDLGTVEAWGAEGETAWRLNRDLTAQATYGWLAKDADVPLYASRYVLDYPEHAASFGLIWRATPRVSVSAEQGVRVQTDNPLRQHGQTAHPARLTTRYAPARWRGIELAVALDNAWDDDFQALAGQPGQGRRASASVRAQW